MDRRVKISTVGALFVALTGSTLLATPAFAAEDKPVYVVSTNSAATVSQILTTGDSVAGSAKWQGIPDGMGAIKNPDGTVSVFVNHELSANDPFVAKTERAYGGYGSTISKVTTNAAGTSVTKIESAIKKVSFYDYQAGVFGTDAVGPDGAPDADAFATPNHSSALNRFCSATLVAAGGLSSTAKQYVGKTVTVKTLITARYWVEINGKMKRINAKRYVTDSVKLWQNSAGKWTTKKVKRNVTFGTTAPIFLTGEEGSDESRIFGLNTGTGELVQLPALGLGATENVSVAAGTGMTTVAMIGEDGDVADSQLFMYKGTKTKSGTWYARAGLANGQQHVASISSLVNVSTTLPSTTVVAANAAITNDVIARATLDRKVVSSAVRGGDTRKVASTKFAIANGVATVTATNYFVAGEVVAIAGLPAGAETGIDVSEVKLLSASATAYTFATDGEDVASADNSTVVATPAANRVLVTTATAHNLVEGDKVSITLAGEISGQYVVTGVPSTTKFTVDTVSTTASTFAITSASRANRLLNVEFKQINTKQSGLAQAATAKVLGTEFSRVEDATFNPANPNEFFFVTTQSDADGTGWTANATGTGATVNSPAVKEGSATPARDGGAVWKLTYVDVTHPELGATLDLVLNGSEAPTNDALVKLNKMDNITLSNDGTVAFLQEDPGGNDHVARLLAVRLSDGKLVSVAAFDPNMFGVAGTADNANAYMTNDEEASGIFDATSLFGGTGSTFVFNAQVHPVTTLGGLNSSSNGLSFASDPLKATATALLRPDLRTKAVKVAVSGVSVAAEATSSSLFYRDMTLTIDNASGLVAANDIINVSGLTRAHNGTYAVKSVTDTTVVVSLYSGKSATISASKYNSPSVVGTGNLFVSDADEDMAIKNEIIEGGALYTLKITSLTALFADIA